MSKRESSSPAPAKAPGRSWRNALGKRQSPLDSAIVAFPLFVVYQVGILGSETKNGADMVTHWLITLSQADFRLYLLFFAISCAAYLTALWALSRTSNWNRRTLLLTLIEALFYALSLGAVVNLMMAGLASLLPGLNLMAGGKSFLEVIVVACGAGVHEELVFRVLGVGALATLLGMKFSRKASLLIAVLVSSILFSLAHHTGSMGEAFSIQAFVFRALAGLVFAVIYLTRGAGVAIWTHTLYDIYVLGFLHPESP